MRRGTKAPRPSSQRRRSWRPKAVAMALYTSSSTRSSTLERSGPDSWKSNNIFIYYLKYV